MKNDGVTRITVTLRLWVDDPEVEKMVYEHIEDANLKELTNLLKHCIKKEVRMRSTRLEPED